MTLEQDNGVWWFIGPDSMRFISLEVSHIELHLWLGLYNERETFERHSEDFITMDDTFNPYGDGAEDWIETIVGDISELGFRTNIRPSRTASRRQTRWPIGGSPT